MEVVYKRLDANRQHDVYWLCKEAGYNEAQMNWTFNGLTSGHPMFMLCGEYVDGKLNGIMSSCSLGYLFGVGEFLPAWVGMRVDRIQPVTSFTTFIHYIASLSTDYFEAHDYWQHYLVRKLPRGTSGVSHLTERSFRSGPYEAYVDATITSEEQLAQAPALHKHLIGRYSHPVAIINMVMRNEYRGKRGHEIRTSISL